MIYWLFLFPTIRHWTTDWIRTTSWFGSNCQTAVSFQSLYSPLLLTAVKPRILLCRRLTQTTNVFICRSVPVNPLLFLWWPGLVSAVGQWTLLQLLGPGSGPQLTKTSSWQHPHQLRFFSSSPLLCMRHFQGLRPDWVWEWVFGVRSWNWSQ